MQFYGQWNPPQDQVLYENYFKDKRNGFYIECGAEAYGIESMFFEVELEWTGINIEASKYQYAGLIKSRPNSINLNLGLSNKTGTLEFTDIVSAPGGGAINGSFTHKDFHKADLIRRNCVFETYSVKVETYKNIISQNKVDTVDLFILDVEGHEVEVMEGMLDCSVIPSVLCVEYVACDFKDIETLAKKMGYIFNFFSFNNAFFSHIQRSKWFGDTGFMTYEEVLK